MEKDPLLFEIDEALRRDKLQQFWRSFGSYVVNISIAIILLTVGIVGWQQHRRGQQEEWSSVYLDAQDLLEAGKKKEAHRKFKEISEKGTEGHAMLANLMLLQMDESDSVKIPNEKDNPYTQYGHLFRYSHFGKADSADQARGSYRLATEETAGLLFYLDGKNAQAAKKFTDISNDIETPQTMRERVNLLLPYVEESDVAAAPLDEPKTTAPTANEPAAEETKP